MTSPCINICHLNDNDICVGCFRSGSEIADWKNLDSEARKQISIKAQKRELMLNVPKTH
tara:strand:- start:3756 stop:3932 length:177 start_codon:yes stop_codon:yes gene_type:complete